MSKQKIYIGKTREQFIDWLKNEYHYTPVPEPEPADQFNFLYKKEGDIEWQEWTPQSNDIQIVDGKVTINATSFKKMDGFADVREVKLPNKWNNGSDVVDVTSIVEQAFIGCSGLTSVMIPDSVTSIGAGTFWGCTRLANIVIPDSVTNIGSGAFFYCSGLTSVTIPDGVTSIETSAFSNCSGITSMMIGNGVTSIGILAFYSCSGLASVTIPDSVTSIGSYAFQNCSGLASVAFNGNAPTVSDNAFLDVALGCKAVVSSTATGFPAAGQWWNRLIVEVKQ